MIIKKLFKTREDGVKLYRHYSDQGFMVRQVETDILYSEPIDVEDAPFTYEESDVLIERDNYGITEEEILASDEISAKDFMALVEEALQ